MIEPSTNKLIDKMQNKEPLENPCPTMIDLGYKYRYVKGAVDTANDLVRVEEDRLVYTNKRHRITFNLVSKGIVVTDLSNSRKFYKLQTIFLNKKVMKCLYEIYEKLGWE